MSEARGKKSRRKRKESSSSEDESYVNAAAKYKKAVTSKIKYTDDEEENIADFHSQPYYRSLDFSQNKNLPKKPSPKKKSPKKKPRRNARLPTNHGEKDKQPNVSSRTRYHLKRQENDDEDTEENSDLEDASSNSSTSRPDEEFSTNLSSPVIDTIVIEDSCQDLNFSRISDLGDYVLLGSPEEKKEDENYSIDVKIIWKSKDVVKLPINRYDQMKKIFKHFAELENVSEDHILITKNDKPIKPTDTPVSLELTIVDILEGGVVKTSTLKMNAAQVEESDNMCKIKVQSANSKKAIVVKIRMIETFRSVLYECAHALEVDASKIKLYFDGEQIDLEDTPESLDLEQEACVDLKITSN